MGDSTPVYISLILVCLAGSVLMGIGGYLYFQTNVFSKLFNSSNSSSNSSGNNSGSNSNAPTSPTPGPASTLPTTPISDPWAKVASKGSDDEQVWAGKIYDAMVGDPLGTRKSPYEGGVGIVQGAVSGKSTLDTVAKNGACENPCYWYYQQGSQASKDKMNSAGLCDCTKPSNSRAI